MSARPPSILIVDDETDLREAIAFDFQRRKFQVFEAACGNDAKKILEKHLVDVVVSDMRMPNGNGMDLLQWVKERNAFLPVVIFITGFADVTLEEAYDKGADAVFAKPFERAALFAAVGRALQPPDQRFLRKATRVEAEVPAGIQVAGSGFHADSRAQNLGRGGMFVALGERLPEVQDQVDFRLRLASGVALPDREMEISGSGIVRWVRAAPAAFPPGCGIEFLDLSQECRSSVIHLINFLKTRSFIPKK